MKRILLTFFILSFVQVAGMCQSWKRLNFNEYSLWRSYLSSIAAKDGQFFFANLNGIYKSSDGGENWVYVTKGLSTLNATQVNNIYADESGIYLATLDGVYKSVDNGANWIESNYGIEKGDKQSYLIFRLNGDLFVYGGIQENLKLYKSTNNGAEWTPASDGLAFNHFCQIGSFIFGTKGGTLKKSSNGIDFSPYPMDGINWPYIYNICGAGEDLFLSADNIYYSKAGGPWEVVNFAAGSSQSKMFYVNNKLFITDYDMDNKLVSIYTSSDKGKSWAPISISGLDLSNVTDLNFLNNNLIAVTSSGLFFLENGKDIWEKKTKGMLIADA